MTCPYCNSHCNDKDTVCSVCQSILPPPGYTKEKFVVQADKNSEIYEKIKHSNTVSLESCFVIDQAIMADESHIEVFDSICTLFDTMYRSIFSSGIEITREDFLTVFSALCAGRVIHILKLSNSKSNEMFEKINECFSGLKGDVFSPSYEKKGQQYIFGSWETDESGNKFYKCTNLLSSIYTASVIPTPIVQLIRNKSDNNIGAIDPFVRSYADDPNRMHGIQHLLFNDISILPRYWPRGGLYVSKNMWFVYLDENARKAFDIYPTIEIPYYSKSTDNVKNSKRTKCHVDNLIKLCADARKEHYFSENIWRKIDLIEKMLRERKADFYFDNALIRNMECYSSVYMSCGGSENEALDMMIKVYLLHIIDSIMEESNQNYDAVQSLFETAFSDFNLPQCIQYINEKNN